MNESINEMYEKERIKLVNSNLAQNMKNVRKFCLENGMVTSSCDMTEAEEVIKFIKIIQEENKELEEQIQDTHNEAMEEYDT